MPKLMDNENIYHLFYFFGFIAAPLFFTHSEGSMYDFPLFKLIL